MREAQDSTADGGDMTRFGATVSMLTVEFAVAVQPLEPVTVML